MQRLRIIIYLGLALAWCVFALWQYRDYLQQGELIEESLHQQSHSIMTAMVGGMRSHRRLGRFFEDQLQGMLDELVKSHDIVHAAIYNAAGQDLISAGDATAADRGHLQANDSFFRLVETFKLSPPTAGPVEAGGGGRGGGPGGGMGIGRGRGGGARHWEEVEADDEGAFGVGGVFVAKLVLDRRRANELATRMTWSHVWAAFAAGFVALSVGLVWRATMNLAEARGQTRVFEAETRHLRELSQAAAGLAHETRNPLGLIRGWTQRLAETAMEDAQRQEQSGAIIEECDRVTARINQFLAFARPCEPDIQRLDIKQMLDELMVIMQPDLEMHQLSVQCDIEPSASIVEADCELLRQVVFNLLLNAVHFSPPQAIIDVTVSRHSALTASLRVADRGPGVQQDAIKSLFTPYFTTRPQGTGLGLAIVRHIATLHEWTVTYRERDGGGAVFEIGNMHVPE